VKQGDEKMRNNTRLTKNRVVWGSITFVLFLTLFTMTSLTAFALNQKRSAFRSSTASSLQQEPSGRAELKWDPQRKVLTVTLFLSGLQPGSNHAAHLHAGTCSSREEILYPFPNAVANAVGDAVSTTTFNDVTGGIPATGWNVTAHNGPTAQTGTLLCGNVANPMRATSVTVLLH
jgi:hypothetical protein